MKCDFCDKEAHYYTKFQAAIYCDDHYEEATEIERLVADERERTNLYTIEEKETKNERE